MNAISSTQEVSQRNLSPQALSDSFIHLQNVSKTFPGKQGATLSVANLNLEVKAGEFLCLVGPSGCGKSTLLNLIAGLEFPTTGQVVVNGKPVERPGPDRTVMFQDSALFPWLTLRQNIAFPLQMSGVESAQIKERVEQALSMVHLRRFADAPVHTLSGGMKQRGALARALVTDPETLLMDEPFASLDAQTRDVLYDELERVWLETRKTVIFVTHNVREAVRLADRLVILATRPGRVRKTIPIDLPRPRTETDHTVAQLSAVIMDELRDEIGRVQREEADDGAYRQSPARPRLGYFGLGRGQ